MQMYYIFLEKASIFLFICYDLFIYQRDTLQDREPYLHLTSNQFLVQRSALVHLEHLEYPQTHIYPSLN